VGLVLATLRLDAATEAEQAGDADSERSPWSVFPILAYSPETSAMLGAGLVYTFEVDPHPPRDARRSALALASAYTLENQFFVSLSPNVYWDAEAWNASGEISGSLFPSTYYPVGRDTPADRAEDYTERGLGAEAALTRRLAGRFRSGAQAGLLYSDVTNTEPGRDLDQGRVDGSDGALLIGAGPVLLWDDRDNAFATQRGGLYSLSSAYFAKAWGSNFNVSKYELDARQFFPLGGEHVIGAQIYAVANLGTVPFQTMAALGGSRRMRGFFEGRFRDRNMLTAQVEYRLPLFWRFGPAAFAGVGDVSHDISSFRFDDPKLSGGAGLRFALNQADRVHLRFDAAGTSTGDVNFYVDLGEAF
jgi:outer membrane protein assembly factor BamA